MKQEQKEYAFQMVPELSLSPGILDLFSADNLQRLPIFWSTYAKINL